jgi:hypothetical protein
MRGRLSLLAMCLAYKEVKRVTEPARFGFFGRAKPLAAFERITILGLNGRGDAPARRNGIDRRPFAKTL